MIFALRFTLIFKVFVLAFIILFIQCSSKVNLPAGDSDNGGLFLPEGFEAVVVADSTGRARHIAVNENGDIYVKLRFSKKGEGGNVALRDTDHDGKADMIQRFGDYENEGSLANGIRIHNGYLYFSSERVLYRNKLTPGKLIPDSEMEVVLTDDHEHGSHWHITKPVSFDNKGKMYVPFGSPSNACQDLTLTPGGTPGMPGLDPCPELEEHGGIWKFDADKIGLTQKDGKKFATGIRSVLAMDWNSQDENLYVVMHGRDDLVRLFPQYYSPWQSAVLPSEEFLKIKEGADYGWPYCYYDQIKGQKVLAPEYGGDGNKIGRCADCEPPIMGFPGHWAPNDLLFYQGDQFPERYKKGALLLFMVPLTVLLILSLYFVCFVPFENGEPTGAWEVFADGFAGVDTIVNVSDAQYRPMGIAMGPDGSLYISESRKGKIWRIMYKGDKKSIGEAQLAKMESRKNRSNIKTPHEVEDNLSRGKITENEKLYLTYCGTCHQRDGKGSPGRFPPLAQTDWVTGNKQRLISIVLHGLQGNINVNGEEYNNIMPAHSFLGDEEVSKVLTYIRQNFGNNADPVSPEEVKNMRQKQLLK